MLRNQCLWETLVSPFSKTQACTTLADKQIYLFHVRNYCVLFYFFNLVFIQLIKSLSLFLDLCLDFSPFFRRAVSTDFIH